MPTRTLVALLCLCLSACGTPIAPAAEPLAARNQEGLQGLQGRALRFSESPTHPDFRHQFAIADTADLYLAFDARTKGAAPTGGHHARFEISSPGGAIFQVTDVPYAASHQGARVWTSLPIAGTWIAQYAITGSWEVRVFLDDASEPAGTATFVLQ